MSRETFRQALFEVIELVTQQELRTSSKKLILGYFNMSGGRSSRARARETIERYTQTELPPDEELAERNRTGMLSRLDRLMIAMEIEADRFDKGSE